MTTTASLTTPLLPENTPPDAPTVAPIVTDGLANSLKELLYKAIGISVCAAVVISMIVVYIYSQINSAPQMLPGMSADTPIGTIVPFAGPAKNIPNGWLLCDGSSYAPSQYSKLFDIIKYAYGQFGINFLVPDTRGLFLRGVDSGLNRDAGRVLGTTQADALGSAYTYTGRSSNEIGMVAFYAVNSPPVNWLSCDGTTYKISEYKLLYGVIGNLYGGTAGGTFAVPDIRGVFIRGFDPTGSTDGDRNRGGFGGRQGHMFARHSHGGVMRHPGGMVEQNQEGRPEDKSNYNQNTDETGGSETRPVNIALLPCIRYL